MNKNRRAAIRRAAAEAKECFETLDAAGIFPQYGSELFVPKHKLIKAINYIVSITKIGQGKWV